VSDSPGGGGGAGEVLDVAVVGAGFAGLYALHRLRELGFSVLVVEAGSGVGGTWFWNRYPGARCDVESVDYSYSFSKELEQEWTWTERYAAQPEILDYLNFVADKFDLRRDIRLDTRIGRAHFDEGAGRWELTTEGGEAITARFCVMATGCLSDPKLPEIEGVETFSRPTYHTGRWPHRPVDFSGQRVGVIGTGSSAIQSIPHIAAQAAQLVVFQRTPNFSVPAWNRPLDPEYVAEVKGDYPARREVCRQSQAGFPIEGTTEDAASATRERLAARFEERWAVGGLGFLGAFSDLLVNEASNHAASDFLRDKIREQVRDPGTAAALSPSGYPCGTKRLCVDTGYYETFNRTNVVLVDLRRTPIERITETEVVTTDAIYELDALVFATGFDAMTGALSRIEITGVGGRTLAEKWRDGPRAHLGIASAGFPNLFMVTGPGSPSVLSNMVVSIEQHVDWIADCLVHLREGGLRRIEPSAEAEDQWVSLVSDIAAFTLFPKANSWYLGANVEGKPRVFMPYVGGVGTYRQQCAEVAAHGYEGFVLA
jgi:cation diffusion facilitator CzcD-associated flavoprotein CzcO